MYPLASERLKGRYARAATLFTGAGAEDIWPVVPTFAARLAAALRRQGPYLCFPHDFY